MTAWIHVTEPAEAWFLAEMGSPYIYGRVIPEVRNDEDTGREPVVRYIGMDAEGVPIDADPFAHLDAAQKAVECSVLDRAARAARVSSASAVPSVDASWKTEPAGRGWTLKDNDSGLPLAYVRPAGEGFQIEAADGRKVGEPYRKATTARQHARAWVSDLTLPLVGATPVIVQDAPAESVCRAEPRHSHCGSFADFTVFLGDREFAETCAVCLANVVRSALDESSPLLSSGR